MCSFSPPGRKERKNNLARISYPVGMGIRRHFIEHPASVGETYGEHFRMSAGFARSLALAAGAAAVHAVIPSMFEKSASTRIIDLHTKMTTGARAATHRPAADAPAHAA